MECLKGGRARNILFQHECICSIRSHVSHSAGGGGYNLRAATIKLDLQTTNNSEWDNYS